MRKIKLKLRLKLAFNIIKSYLEICSAETFHKYAIINTYLQILRLLQYINIITKFLTSRN